MHAEDALHLYAGRVRQGQPHVTHALIAELRDPLGDARREIHRSYMQQLAACTLRQATEQPQIGRRVGADQIDARADVEQALDGLQGRGGGLDDRRLDDDQAPDQAAFVHAHDDAAQPMQRAGEIGPRRSQGVHGLGAGARRARAIAASEDEGVLRAALAEQLLERVRQHRQAAIAGAPDAGDLELEADGRPHAAAAHAHQHVARRAARGRLGDRGRDLAVDVQRTPAHACSSGSSKRRTTQEMLSPPPPRLARTMSSKAAHWAPGACSTI